MFSVFKIVLGHFRKTRIAMVLFNMEHTGSIRSTEIFASTWRMCAQTCQSWKHTVADEVLVGLLIENLQRGGAMKIYVQYVVGAPQNAFQQPRQQEFQSLI